MLTIRTSKFNRTIKKPSSAFFLWFHDSHYRSSSRLAISDDQERQNRSLERLQHFFDRRTIGRIPQEELGPQLLLLGIKQPHAFRTRPRAPG
jgi:hypothetical protein